MCAQLDMDVYARVHVFSSYMRIYAQIFTKFFLVVYYAIISLSFKFHEDPIFRCWDIWKKLSCEFSFAATVRFEYSFQTSEGKPQNE